MIFLRSRPGKPNQRKGQNEKFTNFAHFCEFWCLSLGKQARFTLNFCSGMPPGKVHELTFLRFGLPGPLLSFTVASQARRTRPQALQSSKQEDSNPDHVTWQDWRPCMTKCTKEPPCMHDKNITKPIMTKSMPTPQREREKSWHKFALIFVMLSCLCPAHMFQDMSRILPGSQTWPTISLRIFWGYF